jgi:hypothetical protein
MYDFPYSTMPFLNGVSRGGGIALSQETASSLVNNTIVNGLLKTSLGDKYNESKKETLIKMLSTDAKSPFFYLRSAVVFGIIAAGKYIPHFIQSAFILPFSTTYSFGHGLFYGLLSGSHTSYQDFMSRTISLTLILFHLSVIFVFLTMRRLGVRPIPATIGSLFMLFSITLYSYGYHLGSTVWNFSAGVFFLWFAVTQYSRCPKEVYLRRIPWLAGILVFFSYVVVFYWTSFLFAYFFMQKKYADNKTFFKEACVFLKTQTPAIVLIFLCAFLFYPFGQTPTESIKSLSDVFSFSYYIILNIFSFYNKSSVVDAVQFILAVSLIGIGIYALSKNREEKERTLAGSMIMFFFLILFVPVIIGILSFGPSRHILFIVPFLFVLAGIGMNFIFDHLNISYKTGIILIALVALAGFACLSLRTNDAFDKTSLIKIDPSVNHVRISGCSFHLLYKNWGENRTVEMARSEYRKGDTYYYVGEDTLSGIPLEKGMTADVISTKNVQTGIQFTSYSPEKYPWDRQNGFSAITFRVVDVSI